MKVESDIIHYIEYIDGKYKKAKEKGISRYGADWGVWSGQMNREIRDKIKLGKHPQLVLLKQIFYYWLNRSQLLQLHHIKTSSHMIKRLSREGRKIKKEILNGKTFKNFIGNNNSLDQTLLNRWRSL